MNLLQILIKSGIDSDGLRDFNLEFLIFNLRTIESTEAVKYQIPDKESKSTDTHHPESKGLGAFQLLHNHRFLVAQEELLLELARERTGYRILLQSLI